MRSLTSTIVMVLVLAGLVGYIYYDSDRTPGGEPPKAKMFEVTAENIDEIQIKKATGETARLQRVGTTWQLVEPETADADQTEVEQITSSLGRLDVQRVVDENPADVSQYGLNPANIEVSFRLKDQKDVRRLLLGESTPTGGEIYAKTPDESRVVLLSAFLKNTFDRDAFALRDKAILKFDSDTADSLEFFDDTDALAFQRQGAEWRMLKPLNVRADYAVMQGLLNRLSTAKMQKLVESEAADLRKYGLETPRLRAVVGTGSARATLLVGDPDADAAPFAKDAARPMVFTIEPSLIAEISKPTADFRRKDIFDVRGFTATTLELRRPDGTQIFEKSEGGDGQQVWKDAAGKVIDATTMDTLVTRLASIRADTFEETVHPSLKTPVLTVVATFDNGNRTETLTFGRAGADAYASRADEPGSAKIDQTALDEALKAADGLK